MILSLVALGSKEPQTSPCFLVIRTDASVYCDIIRKYDNATFFYPERNRIKNFVEGRRGGERRNEERGYGDGTCTILHSKQRIELSSLGICVGMRGLR